MPELLFDFNTECGSIKLGKWLLDTIKTVKSINDDLYKIMSVEPYVKQYLDIELGLINNIEC